MPKYLCVSSLCPPSSLCPISLLFSSFTRLAFDRKVSPYESGPAQGFFPLKAFFLATVWLKGSSPAIFFFTCYCFFT